MGAGSFSVLSPPVQMLKLSAPMAADLFEPDEYRDVDGDGVQMNGQERKTGKMVVSDGRSPYQTHEKIRISASRAVF